MNPLQKLATAAVVALLTTASQASELVIVIDDVGNNGPLGKLAVELPAPVNLAFLPETPYAARLAKQAHQRGHNVMLHAPMDNTAGVPLGPGGLYADMSEQEFKQTLNHSLDVIPYVTGFNNHMGSLLTQKCQQMQWAMEVAQQRQLFFVDSRTIANSCAARAAKEAGISVLSRDVFLDNNRSFEALETQFNKAVHIAEARGRAVLIGHPYPETMAYLKAKLAGEKFIQQRQPAPAGHQNHELGIGTATAVEADIDTAGDNDQPSTDDYATAHRIALQPLPDDLQLMKLDALLSFDRERVRIAELARIEAEIAEVEAELARHPDPQIAIDKLKAQGGGLLLASHYQSSNDSQSSSNKAPDTPTENTRMQNRAGEIEIELPSGKQRSVKVTAIQ